ncbi:MAG TPA: pyridoxal phosphate-dependent aminotransferase [Candidatus Elarobacter sp.]|jgi:aspartate aminotransferase/aminotransferase|nr:pyridoxal phosphate-dependent aminotransferase [Candidatus Elarobacter sp.]
MTPRTSERAGPPSGKGAVERPPMQISEKVRTIPQALSIYINQLVYDLRLKGEDVITLSLGEAFFDIPLFDFAKLDIVKGYHYSDSQGIPSLRRRIAQFYEREYGTHVDGASEIMITAGSKPAIFMAMQAVLNPGDEVAILEPAWLSYQEQARLTGASVNFVPYDCPIGEIGRYLTPKTRMLVINNPNNPAGRTYTREELEALYALCRPRGVYILIDEAYSDFVIDEEFWSMARIVPDKDGIVVANSLSKNFGMSGWRIGYLIAHPQFIGEVLKLNQHLITCAPSVLLYYLEHYFDDIIAVTLPQVRQVVEKRNRIAAKMDELGLERMGGSATFYFFVSLGAFPRSGLEFALELLLDHAISVVPGSAYGASTERFIRVSIGTESEERIADALALIRDKIAGDAAPQTVPLAERLAAKGWKPFS